MLAKVIIENGVKKIQALTADTGVGAPVGSIIVVCSNILPSGYIGLGVQYDPTNYPALYQVLGTDTTPTASALGLPTLSSGQYAIKATSGLTENQQENVLNTINENNSYSTEEHPTGKKWIDGKPIYRKVLPNITFSTNVTQKVDVGASIDKGWIDLSKTVFHSTWFPSTRQLFSSSGMTDIFVNDNNSGAESNHVLFTTPFNDGSGVGGTTYIDIVVEYTKTTDN